MKNALTLLRLWCIVTLLSFHSFFISNLLGQCDPVSDSLALVALYNATNGDDWVDNTNWLVEGEPISTWKGVETDSAGCVKKLVFSNNNMVGELPTEIGNYSSIESIMIKDDQLEGNIPSELGDLETLKYLNLTCNGLLGNIPIELGNLGNLQNLRIHCSQLTGGLPEELFYLPNLAYLEIRGNQLTGGINIPSDIGNTTSLTHLFIIGTSISGGIPPEIENLTNLVSLQLSSNPLGGQIPSELGNLHNLQILNLKENQLTGSIPPELGNITSLGSLRLSTNQLSGPIPPELGSLTNLYELQLYQNQLSGTIPAEIFELQNLVGLSLENNQISGSIPIPEEIENISNLKFLNLNGNKLSGSIPATIGNLSQLNLLGLSGNKLSESIPSEIGNLVELNELYLSNNLLTGSIPSEIGNLVELNILYLRSNFLTGSIPSEVGDLINLNYLFLENNFLTGSLPIELSNLTNLNVGIFLHNQFYGCFPPQYSVFCNSSTFVDFSNNPGLPGGGDFEAFCQTGFGSCDATISGKVILDQNQNCFSDTLEIGLRNWMIKANSDQGELYSVSNDNGEYGILTHPGSYDIELIYAPGPYWEENCTGIQNVIIEDSLSLDTINFFPSAIVLCPYLTVDISTSRLRRCFDNTFKIDYCNYGTVNAEEALVKIHFDPLLNVNSASIPIAQQEGNTYTFDLGEVQVGECGSFKIYTTVSCDSELGQTLCATAKIYPDSLCAGFSEEWSGANIEVVGACEGGEVLFTISNTAEGDMQSEQTYTIIQDGVIITPEPIPFFLSSGESIEVNFEANGSTYACQTTPVPFHPFESIPSAFVEACGTNETGGFSTGYATQFPENDSSPFVSIDCQQVIGSFDPNDKRGFPEGYGESHFIERGQDIEYLIRFQNTGTDTAFTVVVEDVLSPYLEMTSLRLGASSHPYNLEIVGSDTLKFIFESILLVDSTANEPASHGFIKFRISQKPELPLGTVIENQAAISFDFNDPVLTNTTFHTIGENFVEVWVNQLPYIPGLEVSIAPNPVTIEAVIRITGIDFQEAEFRLFNAMGIEVKRDVFSGQELALKKGELPEGLYVFEVLVDGQIGGVGKLVVE
ncbi:MAG: hypothetical protein H7A23_26485 [Leptospiraceae bacterium]|nr:hypothetical protein [Leptospiraceae bacterium]